MAFETGPEKDWAHIRLVDWRGWQHDRWVYFYHNGGPIVVVDEARGPVGTKAGLIWHLVGGGEVAPGRFRLRGGDTSTEMRLVPLSGSGRVEVRERADSTLDVVYWGVFGLHVAMVLFRNWSVIGIRLRDWDIRRYQVDVLPYVRR